MLALLGASLTFAFAPFDYWYLLFLVLPMVIYTLFSLNTSLFWPAWSFGFGYFGAGISWVHVSIAEFGGLPLIASLLLMAILCAYLALYPALTFWLLGKYMPRRLWPLSLPFAWMLMEYLRARVLTGFPWLSIAYSQSNSVLSAYLPVVGETGLSVLIITACCALAFAIKQRNYVIGVSPIIVLFVGALTLQNVNWVTTTDSTRSVALVQGNIEQSMRWQPELDEMTINKYLALTDPYWQHDIVIWPEAALPSLESLSSTTLKHLDQLATLTNTGFITGVVDYNLDTNIAYNSLLALGIDNTINSEPYAYQHSKRFSKHHLLPIGEFVPFEDLLRPLAPIFDLPMSSFTRGEYVQNNLVVNNTSLVPAICFEIAFPKQIAANLQAATHAIVTVSNDAWFGDSHGPHQHLQIAQVRAKEFGLPVLRATNNGVTAIVDHTGNIVDQLPQFSAQVLSSNINLVNGKTPYRIWGDLPVMFLSIFSLFIAFWLLYKQKS
ncbi:MAG: apolipoprotein N-acyltransferase [Glaciecola sp.]